MKASLKRLALSALLLSMSLSGYAQAPRVSNGLRESDRSKRASVQTSNLRRVEDPKDMKDQKDHDGAYWFNRGFELHQSDRYVEAIEAFSQSIALNHRQATAMYNVACGFALLNDTENALFWLERSLAVGFDQTDLLRTDSDLDPLRSEPRFKEIIQNVSFTTKESKSSKKENSDRDRLQETIKDFDQLKRESSDDGNEWYRVGSRFIRFRDFDRATFALTQAVDHLSYRGASAMYNLACTYALKGDRELGLDWLEKSINAGFDDSTKLVADPDIASLRGDPRFKKIQEQSRVLSLSQFSDKEFNDSNYSKRRWAPAIKLYESFVREQPNNGRGWFNFAYALHYSSEHARAVAGFERAVQLGYRTPTAMYNVACAHAMMNHRDAAFEWLDKAVRADFDIGGYVRSDEDLDNLRSDSRFKKFLDIADAEHKDHDKEKHKEKRNK